MYASYGELTIIGILTQLNFTEEQKILRHLEKYWVIQIFPLPQFILHLQILK